MRSVATPPPTGRPDGKQADAERELPPRRIINPLPPPAVPPTRMAVEQAGARGAE